MFTFYYAAATYLQSRRLNAFFQKLNLVTEKNGSLVIQQELPPFLYSAASRRKLEVSSVISDLCVNHKDGHVRDLLHHRSSKRVASIFPKQILDISAWIEVLPTRPTNLPIQLKGPTISVSDDDDDAVFVLLETNYHTFQFKRNGNVLEVETFGFPIAWHAGDRLSLLLKTDRWKLSLLAVTFINNEITLQNGVEILRIQTVETTGTPYCIRQIKNIPETYSPFDIPRLTKKELKKSFLDRWRAHISMLCTFCEAVGQVKETQQDITVRHFGSGVGSVTLAPSDTCPTTTTTASKSSETEAAAVEERDFSRDTPESRRSSSLASNVENQPESPTVSNGRSSSQMSSEMTTAQGSTRLVADSATTSMSSLKSLPNTPRKTVSTPVNSMRVKPPNIIIFSDSASAAASVKAAMQATLAKDSYTIHVLDFSDMQSAPWTSHTTLAVIHGNVPPALSPVILKFLFQNSGSLLCLCSDFLGSIVPVFQTAEVRPNELVQCSYKSWKHVPLIHHVLCYQPTPTKSQFSCDEQSSLKSIPDSVQIADDNGKNHTLKIDILGFDETWQTPSVLLVSFKDSSSKIIFSQVHLEIDPGQYESDDKKRQALEKSDKARLGILKDVLGNQLGLQCADEQAGVKYSPSYLLGNHELKNQLLQKLKSDGRLDASNTIQTNGLSLIFCGKGVSAPPATATHHPVLLHACPDSFSTVEYFDQLKTTHLGRLVMYSDVLTTSQDIVDGVEYTHGFTVIPVYQTKGKGRSGNSWLSPKGSAMFSMQLHVPLSSILAKYITLVQHIIATSIVASICEMEGLEELDIGIKWPNDVYANKKIKIGGLLVTSVSRGNVIHCNMGVGVNLSNKEPTISINDMIALLAQEKNIKLPPIKPEKYFSAVFNKLEEILNSVNSGNLEHFFSLYYNYWLHSDADVEIVNDKKHKVTGKIKGVDEYGYLTVDTPNGTVVVQPDGNSFDMMSGLIAPKLPPSK